jgi:hypothetical protein
MLINTGALMLMLGCPLNAPMPAPPLLQINHDIDLDTIPFVGFYKGCMEKNKRSNERASSISMPLLRLWLRLQVGMHLTQPRLSLHIDSGWVCPGWLHAMWLHAV